MYARKLEQPDPSKDDPNGEDSGLVSHDCILGMLGLGFTLEAPLTDFPCALSLRAKNESSKERENRM